MHEEKHSHALCFDQYVRKDICLIDGAAYFGKTRDVQHADIEQGGIKLWKACGFDLCRKLAWFVDKFKQCILVRNCYCLVTQGF